MRYHLDRRNLVAIETGLVDDRRGAPSSGSGEQAMHNMINRIKELTGIYGLGFERESVMGIALPVGFVVVVGGLGWILTRLL